MGIQDRDYMRRRDDDDRPSRRGRRLASNSEASALKYSRWIMIGIIAVVILGLIGLALTRSH